jgi:hypothetical protein
MLDSSLEFRAATAIFRRNTLKRRFYRFDRADVLSFQSMTTPLLPRFVVTTIAAGLLSFVFATAARADQPHMQAALQALQTARAELQQAEHDKAGHREKALDLVDRALHQTQMGIAAGA